MDSDDECAQKTAAQYCEGAGKKGASVLLYNEEKISA